MNEDKLDRLIDLLERYFQNLVEQQEAEQAERKQGVEISDLMRRAELASADQDRKNRERWKKEGLGICGMKS